MVRIDVDPLARPKYQVGLSIRVDVGDRDTVIIWKRCFPGRLLLQHPELVQVETGCTVDGGNADVQVPVALEIRENHVPRVLL